MSMQLRRVRAKVQFQLVGSMRVIERVQESNFHTTTDIFTLKFFPQAGGVTIEQGDKSAAGTFPTSPSLPMFVLIPDFNGQTKFSGAQTVLNFAPDSDRMMVQLSDHGKGMLQVHVVGHLTMANSVMNTVLPVGFDQLEFLELTIEAIGDPV